MLGHVILLLTQYADGVDAKGTLSRSGTQEAFAPRNVT